MKPATTGLRRGTDKTPLSRLPRHPSGLLPFGSSTAAEPLNSRSPTLLLDTYPLNYAPPTRLSRPSVLTILRSPVLVLSLNSPMPVGPARDTSCILHSHWPMEESGGSDPHCGTPNLVQLSGKTEGAMTVLESSLDATTMMLSIIEPGRTGLVLFDCRAAGDLLPSSATAPIAV
ncbi:hypothetical protein CONLIGDRAFT_685937 [Coniochaeta ligniaria NRRL 30616]|uniref:Uncharacterized protein n=1 Tax=Coniochaeta ligniaria NRRL 30616 TaxID=1408157 RepID=A0A1J7J3B8_9PEZI|nr:hypothetical protein CONLIGDRAFT_685937 [Coniochaeta ligniaria NRRL 30616]